MAAREAAHGGNRVATDVLRALVSVSTGILLWLLVSLYSLQWRMERLRSMRLRHEPLWPVRHMALCAVELLACAVHCPPLVRVDVDVSLDGASDPKAAVPNAWSLLMFARAYLLLRLVQRAHVRTTATSVFAVKPNRGVLQPGSHVITVKMH